MAKIGLIIVLVLGASMAILSMLGTIDVQPWAYIYGIIATVVGMTFAYIAAKASGQTSPYGK